MVPFSRRWNNRPSSKCQLQNAFYSFLVVRMSVTQCVLLFSRRLKLMSVWIDLLSDTTYFFVRMSVTLHVLLFFVCLFSLCLFVVGLFFFAIRTPVTLKSVTFAVLLLNLKCLYML